MTDKDKLMLILHDAETHRDLAEDNLMQILDTETEDRANGFEESVTFDYGMRIGYQYARNVFAQLVDEIQKLIAEDI